MEKNKIIIIGSTIIGLLVLLLLVLWLITVFKPKYYTYDDVVKLMQDATNSYYKNNPEMLPVSEGKSILPYSTLVDNKYIKPLNELLTDGNECSAEVFVYKKNDDYNYIPQLNCSDKYTTKELYRQILDSNEIVTSGSGLYKDEEGDYYFRGKVTNNYLSFGSTGSGKKEQPILWRIMSIDNDNLVKIRATIPASEKVYFDDRYNVNRKTTSGYNIFTTSLLKEYLVKLQDTEEFLTEDQKKFLVAKPVCDMPRGYDDITKDGSTECANENADVLLFTTITAYEYMRSSIDENCTKISDRSCSNFNYLTTVGENGNEWSITPFKDNDYDVFTFDGATFITAKARTKKNVYVVAYISEFTNYVSGTGTKTDPYKIIREKKSTIVK